MLLDWDIQDRDGIEAAGELRDRFGEKFTLLLLSDGEWDNLEVQARAAGIDGLWKNLCSGQGCTSG